MLSSCLSLFFLHFIFKRRSICSKEGVRPHREIYAWRRLSFFFSVIEQIPIIDWNIQKLGLRGIFIRSELGRTSWSLWNLILLYLLNERTAENIWHQLAVHVFGVLVHIMLPSTVYQTLTIDDLFIWSTCLWNRSCERIHIAISIPRASYLRSIRNPFKKSIRVGKSQTIFAVYVRQVHSLCFWGVF